ncbi:MAG: hypothetical protein V1891_03565 [bacterium]
MRNINPQTFKSSSLFAVPLENLIPKDHPKRTILDKLPWDDLERIAKRAYKSDYWKDKPNARIMIGLLVYHSLNLKKDYREIAEDYTFNLFCAYACGYKTFDCLRKINHSTLIKFEEHLGEENLLEIKDIIEKASIDAQPPNSKGRHSSDSTVIESNVTFPTDTKLMEAARKFLVNDIIKSYQNQVNQDHRHYDRVARQEYLNFCKTRIHSHKDIQKAKKKHLQFLKRNIGQAQEVLNAIEEKLKDQEIIFDGNNGLNRKAFKRLKIKLETAKLIYKQQHDLYNDISVKDRIVSFHRPSVRPIFRGKAQKKTEFGVKVYLSRVGKALIINKTSYDNFYDGHGLQEGITSMQKKDYSVKEIIGDKGHSGCSNFLKNFNITDGLEKRGKQSKDPPIPKKRFVRARNQTEGLIGTLKWIFIGAGGLRAKTDFGDTKTIFKAAIGFNLTYAF